MANFVSLKVMKIFSKILLRCIPERLHSKLFKYYVNNKYSNRLLTDESFIDDYHRIKKYSVMSNSKSKDNLITLLVSYYHVIEKGFSMPDFRIGFGQSAIIVLIDLIKEYQHKIGDDDEQYLESIRYEVFNNVFCQLNLAYSNIRAYNSTSSIAYETEKTADGYLNRFSNPYVHGKNMVVMAGMNFGF